MNFKYSVKSAIRALRANKSRSALTILGIVIGITSIILVMSIGKGAENLILSQVQGLGGNTLIIRPGRKPSSMMSSMDTILNDSLKERELEAIENKNNIPEATRIMPMVFGSATATYSNNIYRMTVFGSTELIQKIYDIYPTDGRFFDDEEIKGRASVAVIGVKIKEELFGDSQAIGEFIKVKGRNFKVIGILPKKSGGMFSFDEAAFIPYTTVQQYVFGTKHFQGIMVEVGNDKYLKQSIKDVEITLRNLHNIDDGEKDDFYIETQEDIANQIGTITSVLTLFLVSVAAISLLVGGVGIMNIMLVSVTERTREIGLRKAIGGTKKDILSQFLLEAVFLTSAGGIMGIILGALLSFVTAFGISQFGGLDWQFVFPIGPAILGLVVSAGIGLIFGLYPANKASKKSPIEALRYE